MPKKSARKAARKSTGTGTRKTAPKSAGTSMRKTARKSAGKSGRNAADKSPRKTAEAEQVLAAGKYVRLVNRRGWEYVERTTASGIVVLVAVTDDDKLLLVEQYRPPVRSRVIELPAGLAGDVPGEEAEQLATAAQRELLEETGYEARTLEYLTQGPPSAGLSTEVVTLFLARGLRKTGLGGGDESEDIEIHEVPLGSAFDWIEAQAAGGALIDPKVYTGLYFAGCSYRKAPRPRD